MKIRCAECRRLFDRGNETEAAEWAYGHDCDAIETCHDCGHAVDGHDRRGEDGECFTCNTTNGICRFPSEYQRAYVKREANEAIAYGRERRRHHQSGELITARHYIDEQLAFALSRLYSTQQEYTDLGRALLQAMYIRPPTDNEAGFFGAVSVYYGDAVLLEPKLLGMYDDVEQQVDRALAR